MKSQLANRTIFIVEDDEPTRIALQDLLANQNVNCIAYESAEQFLEENTAEPNGCMVLDLNLKEKSGLELLRITRNRGWTLPTLVISGSATISEAMEAMRFGVLDVIEKPILHHQLKSAIDIALSVRPKEQVNANREILRQRLLTLSNTEKDVLQMLLEGRLNKSIAYRLDMGLRTVVRHRKNIMTKLEFETVPKLVRALTIAGLTDGIPTPARPSYAPLSQRLRHDLRNKLNAIIVNYQLYRLQVKQNQLGKANLTGQRVESALRQMADDPCLVSPTFLAKDVSCLPVVMMLYFEEHESNLLSALVKLNEFYPEVCANPSEVSESLDAIRNDPPVFILVNYSGVGSDGEKVIDTLKTTARFESSTVIAISNLPPTETTPLMRQQVDRFFQRPLDAMKLIKLMFEELVSGIQNV